MWYTPIDICTVNMLYYSHPGCVRVAASSEQMLWRSVWWNKLSNHLKPDAPVRSGDHDAASTDGHFDSVSRKTNHTWTVSRLCGEDPQWYYATWHTRGIVVSALNTRDTYGHGRLVQLCLKCARITSFHFVHQGGIDLLVWKAKVTYTYILESLISLIWRPKVTFILDLLERVNI